jgi:PAS domain S-box-containing protein
MPSNDVMADPQAVIAGLRAERDAALAREVALAEVLAVINRSPGDPGPVFDAILQKAHSLCGATIGSLQTYDGTYLRTAAAHGYPPDHFAHSGLPFRPTASNSQRLIEGARLVHYADVAAMPEEIAGNFRHVVELGVRTILLIPLRKDGTYVGGISALRTEVKPFTEAEISLLESFAAQAVIAIENARLLAEQREALEQQTATAEVLQVINSSLGDLAPVFNAILLRAHDLCEASFGALMSYDGERFRAVAHQGTPAPFREFLASGIYPSPGDPFGRMVEGAVLSHTHDLSEVATQYPDHPLPRAAVDLGGIRTLLVVPLRKDGTLLGAITAYRQEVRPFTEKQIALLQNFGAQAVIAMENARLLTETREALEQQTATAEVLGVINTSPGNLVPVFDAILDKAHRLCAVSHGSLHLFDREEGRTVAVRGLSDAYATQIRREYRLSNHPATRQLLSGARFVQIDAVNEDFELYRRGAELDGIRTALFVPLRKDEALLGMIVSSRREVRPFLDKEVTLLENFAAQAVIAIENARLLTEQREALERQTATAGVLQIINASPGNLTPVFNAMLQRATRLCGAASGGLFTYDGKQFHTVATLGVPVEAVEFRTKYPPTAHPGSGAAHILRTRRTHQILDRMAEEDYQSGEPGARAMVELGGARTMLNVPLLKDDELVGFFSVYRHEVRAFSDKQIALLENFAAQAVIAMENARLLTEQREALEQQTATAEVLQVINASPGNVAPVFDAMLERALRLCGAAFGALHTYDGKQFRAVALRGVPAAYAAIRRDKPLPTEADSRTGQMLITGRPVQVVDITTDSYFLAHPDLLNELVDLGGARSVLSLPLLKHGSVVGAFVIYREAPGVWPDMQVALLENFAAQAVIAMENARLLTETREALEQQTATAEVLQVINGSPGDLTPVFETILDKAHILCGAALGSLMIYEDGYAHASATHGFPEKHAALVRRPWRPTGSIARLIGGAPLIHTLDCRSEDADSDSQITRSALESTDIRTGLWVPLRKDGALLGRISAFRLEVRPFSEKEIALLESFAAQAVIAMENARLLSEIRQRQEELRVTFEHMGDGVAMFDETQRLVAWNGKFQEIFDLPDGLLQQHRTYEEHLRFLAARGDFGAGVATVEQIEALVARTGQSYGYERTRPDGRVIEIRRNPVPDGGFVLIYSDITERKRSEAEIHAARDAAEAAYRDLKAAHATLIQAEKMASLGQLTAGIAHEIKNPLNFVNNFATLSVDLLDELKATAAPGFATLDADRHAEIDELTRTLASNLEKINEHGRRADGIVRGMLDHSRGSSGERRSVDLNALVDEALNLAYHGARAQDQSFNMTLQRDLGVGIAPITLAPQDITRVLLNLFGNGFYAARKRQQAEAAPDFEPTLKVTTRELGDAIEIGVRDNGIGIPTDIRDKLFQPFFSTKPTGEGTGLGLSISYDIVVQQHGGTIGVDSSVGQYSEFTVMLPRSR